MKTNTGLVEHAEMALRNRWGYVYGTFGTVLNERLLQDKKKQYPNNVNRYETFIRQNWMGKRVADCVGLIKSYLWWNNGNVRYTPSQDKSANGMYQLARKKGIISTIPETPGLGVWRPGHIGIYIGNGEIIESQGTMYGVKKTRVNQRNFTHWLEIPYINYLPAKVEPPRNVIIKINFLGQNISMKGVVENQTNYVIVDGEKVGIRALFETMGLKVGWNQQTQTILVTK